MCVKLGIRPGVDMVGDGCEGGALLWSHSLWLFGGLIKITYAKYLGDWVAGDRVRVTEARLWREHRGIGASGGRA